MAKSLGGWIHSFTVTDTLIHKQGYTIYKITSIVFPRSVPEALTCISVWKRFHDVKRLYREIYRRHKTMQLNGTVPEPSDHSYFKRFDPEVIQKRKEYILNLLDFIAQHPALYKSHPFMNFFNDGHLDENSTFHKDQSSQGNIATICDKLDIQYSDNLSLVDPNRDETLTESLENKIEKPSEETAAIEKIRNEEVPNTSKPTKENVRDFSKILTPMVSFEGENNDYIYEAALEFSRAVQAEVNMDYKEAFNGYKKGVDALLSGAKDDCNDERKLIAKTKVAKYMARADDLFEKFLKNIEDDKTNFQLSVDLTDNVDSKSSSLYLERPWNQLAKYKVLRIIDTVMLVQDVTDKSVYVMKGIEKPASNAPPQTVFLPQDVPYMVNLVAFFNSEDKIFFLMQHAKGGKLFDYVNSYTPSSVKTATLNEIFTEVDPETSKKSSENLAKSTTHDSGFAETPDIPKSTENMDSVDIIVSSQKLIDSVSNTLKDVKIENKKEELAPVEEACALPMTPSRLLKSPKKKTSLPEACVKQWARELITAVHSLHSKGVILGDLHGDNLLLGSKGQLLLSYFYQNEGISTVLEKNCCHKALSQHYVAPERPLTKKSDWWSCGVALYQLLLGMPFKKRHPGRLDIYKLIQYPRVEISEEAHDLLEGLLKKSPDLRFDYNQICSHSFFKGTKWEELAKNGINST